MTILLLFFSLDDIAMESSDFSWYILNSYHHMVRNTL